MPTVKWSVVQKSKNQGGLGVEDISLKNTALLFKWWWRFNKEECPLWKKVVCSCNNLDGGVSFENQNLKRIGGVWADIGNIRMSESSLVGILQVGNGTKTKFWHDLWVQEGRLKEVFPSLYRMTLNKECSIMGEYTISLEDVAHIYGLSTDGVVSGRMDSSFAHLVDKCVANFRIPLGENDHVSSVIKLSWIRQIRDTEALDTPKSVLHYVRCHIFCLIGTTLFPDKSTSMMSCKYLPLLRNFAEKSVLTIGDRHVWHICISPCVGPRVMIRRRWKVP
ncbi:hypothetical protein AHAS_Ahas18G0215600 [Arachis hypogaea]